VTASGKPANPVPNMPDSRCVGLGDGGFYCLAAADAYAIETTAPNLLAAQQMAAAQYIMLMS
jgi:ATP-dependent protease HslVU (ClpYQ) peptidase subunit